MAYDIKEFIKFTGMSPGDSTYRVDGLRQLWVYCRGDRTQLEHMVDYLPFELQDDIFVLSVSDVPGSAGGAVAGVVLSVSFEGHQGGTHYFEYEEQHASVARGRETWGRPTALARVTWDEDGTGVRARVHDYDTEVFSVEMAYDHRVDDSAWSHLELSPQYQVRAVPEKNGPGFDSFDVVTRNPSADYVPQQRLLGRAEVEIGTVDIANGILGGQQLLVREVLGAELRIGDDRCTAENGVPRVVKSLI